MVRAYKSDADVTVPIWRITLWFLSEPSTEHGKGTGT